MNHRCRFGGRGTAFARERRFARRTGASLRVMSLMATLFAMLAPAAGNPAEDFPAWAFPQKAPAGAAPIGSVRVSVPGSRVTLSVDQIESMAKPPDWFPREHPAMPVPVGSTRAPNLWACAYCHLPDGQGRPENASLAGLPAAYIRSQVGAFRSGERRSAQPDWKATGYMIGVANDVTEDETARAADYFSRLPFASHVNVVESRTVPAHRQMGFIYARASGPDEDLGARIIEMPTDVERFEHRDPHSRFVAYVPLGSLARGAGLARDGAFACTTCHGAGLKGGVGAVAPPLAGRSPTYLFRQLYGFHTGARASPAAQPMRDVAARLTQADMIALAAYAASLAP